MTELKEILNTLDKEDLVEQIVEICDSGIYPRELILLKVKDGFDASELKTIWIRIYTVALAWDKDKRSFDAAGILEEGADLCFEAAQRDLQGQERIDFCKMLVSELQSAAEEDGIGMYGDDEWRYLNVRDRIEESIQLPRVEKIMEFTLKVYPKGRSRSVYRILRITEKESLDDLCNLILSSFEFDNSHLYEFSMKNRCYDDENYQFASEYSGVKTTKIKLGKLGLKKNQTFLFHYDFGDDWEFYIDVQAIGKIEIRSIPTVLESKGVLEQYPDWDEELDDDDDDDEEELTEEQKEIREKNAEAQRIFLDSLKGLADSTIERHMDNVDFFLDDFLMYYNGKNYEEGLVEVSEYLGYFFIHKCFWSSPSNLKTTAASIKKFYKCMMEHGMVKKESYQEMLDLVKSNMEDWQEDCRRYNDPDDDYFI